MESLFPLIERCFSLFSHALSMPFFLCRPAFLGMLLCLPQRALQRTHVRSRSLASAIVQCRYACVAVPTRSLEYFVGCMGGAGRPPLEHSGIRQPLVFVGVL